jgi:hypothetical protein
MLNFNKNVCVQSNFCIHKGQCNKNIYGQCIYEFSLYCQKCKYGLKNIYDKCKNNDCPLYLQNISNLTFKNNKLENEKYFLEEDFLEEYNSEILSEKDVLEENISEETISEEDILEKYMEYKVHEYIHNGDCIMNEYGQCKKGWRYFCCCGYGIEGYYSQCQVKKCPKYKSMEKENRGREERIRKLSL